METLSLFDMPEGVQEEIDAQPSTSLDVVKMEFVGAETLSWKELFSGFDTLHAITYSSGIDFVYKLVDLFEYVEILFGCDEVISYSLQEVMAYQCKMVERIRDTAGKMKLDLVSRIENNTLRFYVARSVLSHEKIYLLSAKDGRKRVIMGSANLSRAAFGGYQRENICYVDGDAAYEWYWDCYCQLREDCTDQIEKETLLGANDGDHLEDLPIARTIQMKKALLLQPNDEAKEEVRFVLDVKNLAAKFASCVPKPDKKGKLMLSPEKIKMIRRQVVATQTQEKELRSEYPQLEVFPDELMARLNGTALELSPSRADIEKDVSLFLKYMDGYYLSAYHPAVGQNSAVPVDPERPPAILRSLEKGGTARSHRTIWEGLVRSDGANVSRQMSGGTGSGSAGKPDPNQSRSRLQASAQAEPGDAGAVPPGTPAVSHPSQGGWLLRTVFAGPVHRPSPRRTAGPPVVRPGSGGRNPVCDQTGL